MSDVNTNIGSEHGVPYRGAYKTETDDTTLDQNPDATANGNPSATPVPDLPPEERTYKNRYDAIKAHYDRTVVEDRKVIAGLKAQLVNAVNIERAMPKSPEELSNWRREFPDLYGILVTAIRQESKEKEEALAERIGQVEEMSKRANRDRAEASLMRLHPDFPDLRASEEFHVWVKEQPKQIQDWLYENEDDPLLAARAIDLYKMEKGLKKAAVQPKTRQNLNSAAQAVRTNNAGPDVDPASGKQWKASDVAKLSRHDFDRLEDEIDKSRREGRFVNDL